MKIGPLDIRIHALVYVAAILIIGIVILRMYLGNSGVRLEGYYRSSILAAMNSESTATQQEGIDACHLVINVSPPPSLSGLQQLYTLKGLALQQEGKAFEALSEFERTQAMQPIGIPGLPTPQENRRLALLSGIGQKDISPPQRMALMQTIEKE